MALVRNSKKRATPNEKAQVSKPPQAALATFGALINADFRHNEQIKFKSPLELKLQSMSGIDVGSIAVQSMLLFPESTTDFELAKFLRAEEGQESPAVSVHTLHVTKLHGPERFWVQNEGFPAHPQRDVLEDRVVRAVLFFA